MKFLRIIKQSLISIFANKARSFLTTLGIIIGIGSVIGLMSLGNGVQEEIKGQIQSLGPTRINIVSGSGFNRATSFSNGQNPAQRQGVGQTQSLKKEDLTSLEQLASNEDSINKAAGSVNSNANIKYLDTELLTGVVGVSPAFFEISNYTLSEGDLFDTREGSVAILGSKIVSEIFGEEAPIGKVIKIRNEDFTVIGILNEEPESNFTANTPNYNIYIPDYRALDLLGTSFYSSLIATAVSEDKTIDAKNKITEVLLSNHNIDDKDLADFTVITSEELLGVVSDITGILTSLLSGIAAISLLVGGIGIMNIMLVSVTERTREIGLRKAVGAKTMDILAQFLTEALLLTLIGGIFGIIIGYLISRVASTALGFNGIVTLDSLILAVGVSSAIGIIFGLYPALKAARLNPIDALRFE